MPFEFKSFPEDKIPFKIPPKKKPVQIITQRKSTKSGSIYFMDIVKGGGVKPIAFYSDVAEATDSEKEVSEQKSSS